MTVIPACILNPAIAEFAEDTRRKGRRRILIFQVPDNAVDSVNSAIPKGGECEGKYLMVNSSEK